MFPPRYGASLQLSQHRLGAGNCDLSSRLLLRIHNLAMINDQRIPRSPLADRPAEFLREGGSGVVEEELFPYQLAAFYKTNPSFQPQKKKSKNGKYNI